MPQYDIRLLSKTKIIKNTSGEYGMVAQTSHFLKLFWKQTLASFLIFIYIAINAFQVGGGEFIFKLNAYILFPIAIGLVILAYKLAREIKVQGKNRVLWWGLFAGWSSWLIAQFLYTVIPDFTGIEMPTPSWADFFWTLGYIPMYFALWERLRSLPQSSSTAQNISIRISSILSIAGAVFFVLIPVLQSNQAPDSSTIFTNILNILYPVLDLGLLILVIRIFFIYQQGRYGQVWIWLSLGFILSSFADLSYSALSTAGLYYPDGNATLLSTMGMSIPFNVSYLFWLIGLIVLNSIQESHQVFEEIHIQPNLVPNTHLLVFTKADDTIIGVSANFANVFPSNMEKGNTLQNALGISDEDANAILLESKSSKFLKERSVLANTLLGQEPILVSGIVILSPQGKYSGVYLLLRIHHQDYSLEKLLTNDEKAMVNSILTKTGTKQKEDDEIKQLLVQYGRIFLQTLYNRVFNEGGSIMADTFLTQLQSKCKQQGWSIKIQPDNLMDVGALSLTETQESLSTLIETAKQFVAAIIDEATVNQITEDVRSKFDELTLKNITNFTLSK